MHTTATPIDHAVEPDGRIIVVGASAGGVRTVEALRTRGFSGEILVIGAESSTPYDRPALSKQLLSGELEIDDLALSLVPDTVADWCFGEVATRLDIDGKKLQTDRRELSYDAVVLATGSRARLLPTLAGISSRVHTVRGLEDSLRLKKALRPGVRLLVVGCGFIGVEVASSARSLGVDVTMVGIDRPLALAGPLVSGAATQLLTSHGVTLHPGTSIQHGVEAEGQCEITLSDGTTLTVDEVLVAVGSTPNTDWLVGSGLNIDDGVLCDAGLRAVGASSVVVVGDIARWPNPTFGGMPMRVEHWSNAIDQAFFAARNLLGANLSFSGVPSFWSDHFGTSLQSVGLPRLADRFEVVAGNAAEGQFAAAAYWGDTLVGGVTYGMPRELSPLLARLVGGCAAGLGDLSNVTLA